jgi:tetratricopeptide (TPR) repeat protein
MNTGDLLFHEKDGLLFRLLESLKDTTKEVVFVLGAPLTAPTDDHHGVADVNAVVELIRAEFAGKKPQLDKLDAKLLTAANRYQTAFDFLVGRFGQDSANDVIKKAVARALESSYSTTSMAGITKLDAEQLNALDNDPSMWSLSPAVEALGMLIARFPKRFGKLVITSNFDPLIEIAVRKAGYQAWRTSLSADGSFNTSAASGCQVLHIHGYWHGKDTLHTSTQLVASRPTLKNDLLGYLKDKLVVVIAYGGWPDIFTGALSGIVSDDNLFPDVLWACYGENPQISDYLRSALDPGIKRNRVTFYNGIDCNELLPELVALWDGQESVAIEKDQEIIAQKTPEKTSSDLFRLPPLECDRPPSIDVWVGREDELRALETSPAKVVVICGIGGEGKSVLASHYISSIGSEELRFSNWDWRDCKEQGDRIRTQVLQVVTRLSGGSISPSEIAQSDDEELTEILITQMESINIVVVLDNVDSYIDLENSIFIGLLDRIVQKLSASSSSSRLVLTCRPDVQYPSSSIITLPLRGVSEEEAIELFAKRSPSSPVNEDDIRDAHKITDGHAFWLDLIAVQVTKVPGTTLRKFLNDLRRGREGGPDILSSIWDKLAPAERTLLRFMAEAVRPETAEMIEKFVASQLNFHRFRRALRILTNLNLVVIKPETNAPDLYDLHPLVRHFVRTKFERDERSDYIKVVITQYERIIGAIENFLGINLPFSMMERFSQKAELEISAGQYENAFETLIKVEQSLLGSGNVEEYVRVARLLLEAVDWETAATTYKQFDHVVGSTAAAFEQLGEGEAVDDLLVRHEATVPQKTVRYIKHCDMRAYIAWLRDDYDGAIEWASRGVSLKKDTNVDTSFDCEHTLALAQRDSGQPEVAINFFLDADTLEELIASESTRGGTVYGNVGRCLQLMGEPEQALILYRLSLRALERDTTGLSRSNRAYGRKWVGEVLAEKGDVERAEAFFLEAVRLLGTWAPVRVKKIIIELNKVHPESAALLGEAKASKIVSAWIAEK